MILIENLTKEYRGFSNSLHRFLSVLSFGFYQGDKSYLALENINFQINHSEITGIIGKNGAGKSTLMKILTGVTGYDKGKVTLKGNVRSILELGVGFNPELTGKENVFYNALAMGYSFEELEEIIIDVFQFAGLEDKKEITLKNYSSGMIMRLGFALATAKRPDVLIIDEALSVGDASFQQKCIKRLNDFLEQSTTILVVSHDLHLLSAICKRILILDKGKIVFDGSAKDSLHKYMELIAGDSGANPSDSSKEVLSWDLTLRKKNKTVSKIFFIEEIAELSIEMIFEEETEDITVGFHIEDQRGIRIFGTNTYLLTGKTKKMKKKGKEICIFQFPIHFREGKYSISISIHTGENHTEKCYLWKESILDFEVERVNLSKFEGICHLPITQKWE